MVPSPLNADFLRPKRPSRPRTPTPALSAASVAAAMPAGRRFAYVTLFTKDAYLPGVQALYRSLHVVGNKYPLIVLYTKGVSQGALDSLAKEGMVLHFTEQFQAEGVDHSEYKRTLYLECWNKLRMWEMTQFDRLVYLDADMAVLRSTDHLFDLPPGFYAVGDCYGGREFEEERNSCCHFTPDATPEYFNAGFYVMSPSLAELDEMKAALREGRCPVRFFAEQDFLNAFFKGRWHHLPYSYNGQKRIKFHHPDLWDMADLHIIHYLDEKPWSHRYSEENLQYKEECDYWWDVYEGRLAPPALPERQMSTGRDVPSTLATATSAVAAAAGKAVAARSGSAASAAELTAAIEQALEGLSLEPLTPVQSAKADAGWGEGVERSGSLGVPTAEVRAA